jgi:hypothetical protein
VIAREILKGVKGMTPLRGRATMRWARARATRRDAAAAEVAAGVGRSAVARGRLVLAFLGRARRAARRERCARVWSRLPVRASAPTA